MDTLISVIAWLFVPVLVIFKIIRYYTRIRRQIAEFKHKSWLS